MAGSWLLMRGLLAGATLWFCTAAVSAAGPPRHGLEPPAGIGGPIDLIDQTGAPFSLARLGGRPALVFFGLVHCGSTCPIAPATAQQVLHAFGTAANTPAVVFVTLDPLSDSPRELGTHLERIDPRLIGLTGDPASIERTAERYGVGMRARVGGVDHSSMWYLLDRGGQLQRVYPHTTSAAHRVEDVRALPARSGR